MNITKEKANNVADKLCAFMANHEPKPLSQRKVAKMLGVSPTQISQFLNHKYKGNLEDLINRAVNLINSVSRQEKRVKNKPFINTTIAKRIGVLIVNTETFSEDEGKIGLVIGDGGHGKSHCLKHYAEVNKNTIYAQLDDAMTSKQMFASIAKELNIDTSGSLAVVTSRIIEVLQNRHVIVMLDEAAGLSVKQLNQLRQIIVIKSRCPLILAGNSDLLKTVMQPTTRHGYESLDQFTSRLMGVLNLDEIASRKDGGLYTPEDIRKLYQYDGIKLTGNGVTTLQRICKTPRSGRLRTSSHIVAALHTSKVTKQRGAIDEELIMAVIDQLDLPVRVYLPVNRTFVEDEIEEQQAAVAS
ncbi:MAG: AAA family ATPase [Planctomycetes bacterium]|nr:AAA family ATPase [Planctomycetota bacterium]